MCSRGIEGKITNWTYVESLLEGKKLPTKLDDVEWDFKNILFTKTCQAAAYLPPMGPFLSLFLYVLSLYIIY